MRLKKWLIIIGLHIICLGFLFLNFSLPYFAIGQLDAVDTLEEVQIIETRPTLPERIVFVGDVMLARNVETLMATTTTDYPYKNLAFTQSKPTFFVANFEAAIPKNHIKTKDFGFLFSVDKKYLKSLKEAGVTHVSLANNHAFDFGEEGYLNSQKILKENSISAFGNPNILSTTTSVEYIQTEFKRIALIGINTISGYPSEREVSDLMAEVENASDLQIVYIHWGNEYQSMQSVVQRKFATFLSETGVDLVIGHHPHVVQGIELINQTLVVYSLGNFIFDQYFSKEVQEGLLLGIDFTEEASILSLLPVSSLAKRAQPSLMNKVDSTEFLDNLIKVSSPELESDIVRGQIILPNALASSTEMAIMGR